MKKFILTIGVISLLVGCNMNYDNNLSYTQNGNAIQIDGIQNIEDVLFQDDSILYRYNDSYFLISKNRKEKINANIPSDTLEHQIFLSEDAKKVYYYTGNTQRLGTIRAYNIETQEDVDLLESLGINLDEPIASIAYNEDKLGILLGKKDASMQIWETNRLLLVNLLDKTIDFIDLEITPTGAYLYQGFDFANRKFFFCYSDKSEQQRIAILDIEGKLVESINLQEQALVNKILVSCDGTKFTYQLGMTPTDLHVYDIKSKIKKVIIDTKESEKKYKYCFFHRWSSKKDILYYTVENGEENTVEFIRETITMPQ